MRKIFTLLALFCFVMAGWAQTTTAYYGNGNGTFYNASGGVVEGGFNAKKFVSSTNPAATVESDHATALNAGDTPAANGGYRIGTNSSVATTTITISAPTGFHITGYEFDCCAVNASHPAKTLTTEDGTDYDVSSTTFQNVSVTGLAVQSTYFTITLNAGTGGWSPVKVKNFKIYLEEDTKYNILFNCWDGDNNLLEVVTSTEKYLDGETVDVSGFTHDILGFELQSINPTSVTINGADAEVTVLYAASQTYDYNLVVNGAVDGMTMTIKGDNITPGQSTYSNLNEVVESDVVVTLPESYQTYNVSISGTTITVNIVDTRKHLTNKETNTLDAATIMSLADAGDLYVSIMNHTSSANKYMNSAGRMVSSFDEDGATTWKVVPCSTGGYYLKNSEGLYIVYNGTSGSYLQFTSDVTEATPFEPEDCNADVGDIASGYNSSMAVRWKVYPDKAVWINSIKNSSSETNIYNNGSGCWTCLFTYQVTLVTAEVFNGLKIVDECSAYMTTAVGENFGLSSAAVAALQSDYDQYSVSCTQAEYEAFKQQFNNAVANDVVLPSTGYYRLLNKKAGGDNYGYMGVGSDGKLYGNISATASASDASTVIYFEDKGDGTYNVSLEGVYVGGASSGSADIPLQTEPLAATLTSVAPGIGAIRTASGQYGCLHAAIGQDYRIVSWEETSNASGWIFEEAADVALTLHDGQDGKYYATMYLPFDVTLSNGVKAYTAALNNTKTRVSFDELGTSVPAGTAVLLIGDAENATATITSGLAESTASNALVGVYFSTDISGVNNEGDETKLTLGYDGNAVGFYKYDSALGANKAYLDVSGSTARSFAIVLDDEVTGIHAVNAVADGAKVYDLQGRRVSVAQKGVYIVNGKKVLVK